jgi:glycosyltransferase involved in cell wall biosynthesis
MGEGVEYLVRALGVPPEKIFRTPYSVDVQEYGKKVEAHRPRSWELRRQLGLEGVVFLYVGSMIPRKGIRELAAGIGELASSYREMCSFLFVGGKLPQEAAAFLDYAGARFACVPFVQPGELPRYYAAADAFVFPSLEDEWGIVLNEAAASGLPLVASRFAAATAELVEQGINGLVIDPRDSSEIASALTEIMDLPLSSLNEWGCRSITKAGRIGIDFTVGNLAAAVSRTLSDVRRGDVAVGDKSGGTACR